MDSKIPRKQFVLRSEFGKGTGQDGKNSQIPCLPASCQRGIEHNKEVKEIHLNRNYETPIFEKYSLSIEQAADYFGIGQKKLRQIVADHEGADFILYNGNRVQIKRKKFESFLDKTSAI